ncbi:MAG: hypothetical protein QGH20_11950, partial [Candidatus Latescibacteria bacterium]|nr:hypothetical protein [Candidatus Latescibacterota bacterium]
MRPLVSLIDRLRSQERRVRISKGFALFATTVFASVWVMTVIESLLSLPPNGRIALWAGLLLIVGFGTLRTAWRDYQGVPNPRDAAKLIESEFPQFEESLAAGLEFTTSGPPFGESVDLAVAVADQADERSLGLDIGQLTDTKPLRRWASAFALSALLWAITIWQFAPTALPAFTRLTHPLTRYTTAPQLTLSLLPGSVELVKGDSLATQTLATGAIPESITLQSRKTGSLVWLDTYVTVGDQRIASHVLGPINESIDYRAKAEDAVSQTHTVTAIDPPVARRLWAVLTPPRYAGLPSQELPEGDGNIEGLVDTKASITLNSSKPLQGVWAVFASGDTIEGLTDKHEAKLS